MKKHLFSIFIILLGLFTAYVFYVFWHSNEVNPPKQINEKSVPTSLEDKQVIPKHNYTPQKKILNLKPKNLTTAKKFQNQSHIEEEAEEIYEVLLPDTQVEFIEEAKEAFDTFDEQVIEMEENLLEDEQSVEENIYEKTEENIIEEEED